MPSLPTSGVPNSPWIWLAYLAVCLVVGGITPMVLAKVRKVSDSKPSDALGANSALLSSMIAGLERRAEAAEREVSDCREEIVRLTKQLATANTRIDYLEDRLTRGERGK